MLSAALLVIAIPLAGALLAYLGRRWQTLEVLIALLALGAGIVLLAQPITGAITLPGLTIDIDTPLNLLGRVLRIREPERVPLLLLFSSTAIIFAMSWRAPQGWTFIPIGLAVLAAMSAALLIRPFVYAALALEAAAALAVLMIQGERQGERSTTGAMRYLVCATLALPLFLLAGWSIDRAGTVNLTDANAVAAAYGPSIVFLLAGFAMLFGAIPLYSWIHPVAKDAPPLVTAFLGAVGIGAVTFLLLSFWQAFAWLRTSPVQANAFAAGGMVMLLFGGGLAWAQRSFSRVLACALFVELGCILLMFNSNTPLATESLAFSIIARAIGLSVFGIGIWRLRAMRGSDDFDDIRNVNDLWTTLALLAGGLSLAGLPGTVGFVARWTSARAYSSTDAEGLVLLLVACGSVGIGVMRGVLAMARQPVEAEVVEEEEALPPDAGEQLPLFELPEIETQPVVTGALQPAQTDAALVFGIEPASKIEPPVDEGAFVEGDAKPAFTARGIHAISARFVIAVGIALTLIAGLWPGLLAPIAQAVAAGYNFYR
jgi:formate hydrogenlyase subunit 3/multisubunit Na+/H+ antiporter MnhD subunit